MNKRLLDVLGLVQGFQGQQQQNALAESQLAQNNFALQQQQQLAPFEVALAKARAEGQPIKDERDNMLAMAQLAASQQQQDLARRQFALAEDEANYSRSRRPFNEQQQQEELGLNRRVKEAQLTKATEPDIGDMASFLQALMFSTDPGERAAGFEFLKQRGGFPAIQQPKPALDPALLQQAIQQVTKR